MAGAAVAATLAARTGVHDGLAVEQLDALPVAQREVDRVWRWLDGNRRLRWRTRGRAQVMPQALRAHGIGGPTARAAGLAVDARAGNPLYEALGFRIACADGGDAEARSVLRVEEASVALRLAGAALTQLGSAAPSAGTHSAIEGPRGPICVAMADGALVARAPGADSLLELAGRSVVGAELAGALAGVASFDFSPWRVTE